MLRIRIAIRIAIFSMAVSHLFGNPPGFKQEADGLFTSELGHWQFAVAVKFDVLDPATHQKPPLFPALVWPAGSRFVPDEHDGLLEKRCERFKGDLRSCVLENKNRLRAQHSARFQEINQSTACAACPSTLTAH
jgi:hypothetical protein